MNEQTASGGVQVLIDKIDTLILQHLNYLDRLEKACRAKTVFEHKLPTECNFGKLFYSEVFPIRNSFPEEIKKSVEDIEMAHRIFHETAAKVDSVNPVSENVDATSACQLILKLYKLENMTKKGS